MNSLFIHDDAKSDLESIWEKHPEAAARIVALLQELKGNHDLLDRLTQHDFAPPSRSQFHVSKWFELWNQGMDLWRLKIWDLEKQGLRYRIIYAFIPSNQQYHILGILPREFDYDTSEPIAQRIIRAYQALRENN